MKSLLEFITEALLNENDEMNKDKLLDLLNDHSGSLKEFVDELNDVLKNAEKGDNAKLWMGAIKDLFDGENGAQYKAKNHVAVEVSKLYPTQSEIDIENSAKWATEDWGAAGVADMFKGEAFGKNFPVPVLVYAKDRKGWIIDGHHRWSQLALINPKAKLDCLVVTGPEDPGDFLKITQAIIASVIADDSNSNKGKENSFQLPEGKAVPANNIFGDALAGDKLKDKIVKMYSEHPDYAKTVVDILIKNDVVSHDAETNDYNLIKESGLDDNTKKMINVIATLVTKNRDLMIKNKQVPPENAAPRPQMPQSDAAGPNDPKSAKDGSPEVKGSALYKILHKGKFPEIGKNK